MTHLTVCAGPWPAAQREALFEAIGDFGIPAVELLGEPSEGATRRDCIEAGRRGLLISGLTASGMPRTGRDLASPEAQTRARTLDHYKACIGLAHEFEIPVVGLALAVVGRQSPVADVEEEEEWIRRGLAVLADEARGAGVRLAVEVLNRYVACHANTVGDALVLIQHFDCDQVGLCVDLFHANIEEPGIETAIVSAGQRLANLHIADSNRGGPGSGHIDFVSVADALAAIEYLGPIGLEAKPSQAMLRREGRDLTAWLRDCVEQFRRGPWTAGAVR